MIGIDLCVVNYRTPDDLGLFLESVDRARIAMPFTVTIANVDPLDADVEVGEEWAAHTKHEAFHFGYTSNVGYAVACNESAAMGRNRFIGLFNADVQLEPGAVEQIVGALMSNGRWGFAGPRQVDSQNRLTAAGIFGTPSQPQHRAWQKLDTGKCSDVRDDVVTLAGSALVVKRAVWKELTDCPIFQEVAPGATGAFLPTRLFYEETAACYHARAHDYGLLYYGPARVKHEWHRSVLRNGGSKASLMQESRQLFRAFCDAHGIERD